MLSPRYLVVLFLLFSCVSVFSQITVSSYSACLPGFIASFNYTGPPASSVTWNFGNGNPQATGTSVQSPYTSQGTFNGSCVAIVGGSPTTYTFQIIVYPSPAGSITQVIPDPASGCVPRSVTLTASSSNTNVSYNWTFGDNNGGNGQTAVHVYGIAGTFTPQVAIIDNNTGCATPIISQTQVKVSNLPNMIISSIPASLSSCLAPFTPTFIGSNSSSSPPLGGPLTYSWTFGNSQSGTNVNPGPITYNSSGIYPVSFTGTDNNNCSNTAYSSVSVVTPTLSAIVPTAVCIQNQTMPDPISGSQEFTITVSSSQPSVTITTDNVSFVFPKPIPPSLIHPTLFPNVPYTHFAYAYTTPGTKTFQIIADAGNGCVATFTQTIFVEQITPSFTGTPPFITCQPTLQANIVNQTTVNNPGSSLIYSWTVAPWANAPIWVNSPSPASLTSNVVNPTFTITQNQFNPYTIFGPHSPIIALTVTSVPLGCVTLLNHTIYTVQRPTAIYSLTSSFGCVPHTVTLTSISTTSVNTSISNYTWNVGTPYPIQSGPAPNFSTAIFTFTSPGVYHPTLTIRNNSLCEHSASIATINISPPPLLGIQSISSNTICAGSTVNITLNSNNPQPQHWHVTTDAGFFSSCINSPVQVGQFNVPGVHPVQLSAYRDGCVSTTVSNQSITVLGPAAKIRYVTDCSNKLNVVFHYTLMDVSTATLNFGESPGSFVTLSGTLNTAVTGTVSHSYSATGNYTATLSSQNSGNLCATSVETMVVWVKQPNAQILFSAASSTVFCKDQLSQISALVVPDNLLGCSNGYAWYIDNQPPIQQSGPVLTYSFTSIGTYTIKLRVKDINGCEDIDVRQIRITKPVPVFTFSNNPTCFSGYPAVMVNSTVPSPDNLLKYTWSFGEAGLPFPAFIFTTTNTNPVPYSFNMTAPLTQTFSVKLDVEDVIGCKDSLRQTITINNPVTSLSISHYTFCIENPLVPMIFTFGAAPNYTNYTINFGNGSPPLSTSQNTVAYSYTSTGIYNPTVTITDNAGCQATATFPIPLNYQVAPQASFTYFETGLPGNPPKNIYCTPFGGITFSSTSTSSFLPLTYFWNLDNGIGLALGSFTAAENYISGLKTVSLQVMTTSGCKDTETKTINFYKKPNAGIEISKNPFCLDEEFTVTIKNPQDVGYWQWDFSDGTITPTLSSMSNSVFPYQITTFPSNPNGTLTIYLFAAGDPNMQCKVEPIPTITAKVIRVLPDFKRNNELALSDFAHCLGVSDSFSNTTVSNGAFLTYTWSFGDGNTSTAISPNYTYPLPGNYTVNLIAKDFDVGCTNTISKTMTVFPLPSASLNIEDLACPDSLFLVTGNGAPGLSGTITGTLLGGNNSYNVIFDAGNSFSLQANAPVTTVFSLQVSDMNNCKSNPVVDSIRIQLPPPSINTSTTIIIGQTVTVNGFLGNGYTYVWVNDTSFLSCTNCYNPVSSSTSNITYTVSVTDLPLKCFEVLNQHTVIVRLVASIDVPSAFTPNNDGVNDFIIPAGWGIRKLNYFKVFNRWGQLLFESNDLDKGWDGTFNGIPQNMETYIYQASVDTYTDETLTKSGAFKLIR
jgi:gliding motility-associated-like protein